MSADLDKAQAEGVELSQPANSSGIPLGTYWAQNLLS